MRMNPEAVEFFARWIESPEAFVREELQAIPDPWQLEALAAAGRGDIRIAMKACKGPGKTAVLAWILWWWLLTRPRSKVVATSITEDNLKDCLWAETAKWRSRSRILQSQFTWGKERIACRAAPEEWFASARAWPKDADPEAQADTLAGVHADHVLFILDESGGIPRAVMAAAEAGLANAGKEGRTALIIQAGNPTDPNGPLYDACSRDRHLWTVIEITGDPDSPRRSSRVSISWAREMIAKWGRESPWTLVNVFGQFPPGATNALLSLEEVSEASRRVLGQADYIEQPRIMGLDVARFGDDRSVLAFRQGRVVFRLDKVWRHMDTMELAGQVAMQIDAWEPDAVFIDVTGIGAGVVDRLRQLQYPMIIEIAFGGRSSNPHHKDKRTEMWWNMADWIRHGGGAIPNDSELIGELSAPRYKFGEDGRMKLESKEDMKARGLVSPDKGDAVALTFALPVAPRAILMGRGGGMAKMDEDPYGLTPRRH